ncbi:MAG: hypothetical protein P0S96_04630 [Simkaniaceae bacterium]|nr:hypothetical protein [Candidatus Sacchlamyda saccharinae]
MISFKLNVTIILINNLNYKKVEMRFPGLLPPASSAAIDAALSMSDPAAAENAHGTTTEVEVLSKKGVMESLYAGFQKIVDCQNMGDEDLAKCILDLDSLLQKASGNASVIESAQELMRAFLNRDEARFFEVARKLTDFDFEKGEQPALLTWIKDELVKQVTTTVNPPMLFARDGVHPVIQECRKSNLGLNFNPDVLNNNIPDLFEVVCEHFERGVYSGDGAGEETPLCAGQYAALLFALDAVFQELPHKYPDLKIRLTDRIRNFLNDHPEGVVEIRRVLMESSEDYKQDAIRILNDFQIRVIVEDFFTMRQETSRRQSSNPFAGLFSSSTGDVPYVSLPNGLESLDSFEDYQKGIERHLPDTILPVHKSSDQE